MTTDTSPFKAILTSDSCFALYSLPNSNKVTTIIQSNENATEPINFEKSEGFLLHPFNDQADVPRVLIRPDTVLDGLPDFSQFSAKNLSDLRSEEMDYRSYIEMILHATETIKKGILEKVVLSRTLKKSISNDFSPFDLFEKLTHKYPEAFTYIAYVPNLGLWVGASPETFINIKNDALKTVSLAGTRKKGDKKSKWTQKEKEEQEIVTTYIENILKKHKLNYSKSELKSRAAGNVEHLYTEFEANYIATETNLVSFIVDLHPTPAVGGIPKNKAISYIREKENYSRAYYTGLVGPINMNNETHLFVNLRCLEMFKENLLLYVGGGITADSVPEKEWEETKMKANTLLSVIENL